MSLKNWSNHSLSWSRHIDSRILIFTRKCVCSACWSSVSKTIIYVKNSSYRHHFLANVASSQTFVNWISFSSISNICRHSRNLFPDARLSHLGVCTSHILRLHIFQWLFVLFCCEPFRSWLFLIRSPLSELFTPAGNCSVDTDLSC